MKAKCFLRVARKRRPYRWNESEFVFDVTVKEPAAALADSAGALRTAVIRLNLEFPDELFGPAAQVDISVPARACKVIASV